MIYHTRKITLSIQIFPRKIMWYSMTLYCFINLVQQYEPYCLMTKTDIEDAFQIIPFNLSDYHQLGFSLKQKFYFDKCLPMGASSSCQLFEK